MKKAYPFTTHGIRVTQPFGEFIIATIPAKILLDTAYSDRLKAEKGDDGTYTLTGSQRALAEHRLKEIGKYIEGNDAAFPNTIILAANYREEDGLLQSEVEDESDQENAKPIEWLFEPSSNEISGTLTIPSSEKLAAIIDGQHRLFGFLSVKNKEKLNFPLVCAIFFNLPKPYQAYLFATVNSNQRPVSKSQTYELFGYNVEDEPNNKWTPEKLAVFLTRKLNAEIDSPFHKHIIVPAENDFSPTLSEVKRKDTWAVSTAVVVEGIVRLISKNPKIDAYEMHGGIAYKGSDRSILKKKTTISPPPLRDLYLQQNDEMIYLSIKNFFKAVESKLWKNSSFNSYIKKTVGVQALFDISKIVLKDAVREKDISRERFEKLLAKVEKVNFEDNFFQTSGAGRQRLRTVIGVGLNLFDLSKTNPDHVPNYERILNLR